ncbi:hypothetical protein KKC45_00295 [Patescibacteria group bacterium]|nr:hypothetical protein [Patescibacteria group bacterium]
MEENPMGAKNHQPCNGYLVNSTKLSRSVSLGYIFLEQANVSLEDLLLAELEKGIGGDVSAITQMLGNSSSALSDALKNCVDLRQQMDEKVYSDPDVLATINLDVVGKGFHSTGLVQLEAWAKISELTLTHGFYSVLDHFEKALSEILAKTDEVSRLVANVSEIARTSQVNLVLEENTDANIKVEFFQLYTLWGKFNNEFIASSVLSTELWYRDNGYGSLFQKKSAFSKAM